MCFLRLLDQMATKLDKNDVERLIYEENPTSIDELVNLVALRLNLVVSRSSVHRFLQENKLILQTKHISNDELASKIRHVVSRSGPYYGRKTIKGALATEGIHASQRRIATQLRQINPQNHLKRALNTHRQLNPRRYRAPHFGYNLHLDQNEKLVDYGCVIVLAVDGSSNFLVSGFKKCW
jgi:predicted metal-dependent hydrolase